MAMVKKLLIMLMIISLLSINTFEVKSDDGKKANLIQTISFSFGNRSKVPLKPPLRLKVSVDSGEKFNIIWQTNAYNTSCYNGTYTQMANWANKTNTTYWWKSTVETPTHQNESKIYNFTTATYKWGDWSDWWVIKLVPKEFVIKNFNPINFNDAGMSFELSFDTNIEYYNESIFINVSTRQNLIKNEPIDSFATNGSYIVKDLILPTQTIKEDYPFDEYYVEVNIKTIDDVTINISEFDSQYYDSNQWQMKIQSNNNTLRANFFRTWEKYTYYALISMGIISIFTSFYLLHTKKDRVYSVSKLVNGTFISGVFLGFIFSHFTFSKYLGLLFGLLLISIIVWRCSYRKVEEYNKIKNQE